MTAKELKRIFQKGECLSLDTMRLYNDGKLPKKSVHEVEKHLVECSLCSAAVENLSSRRMAEVNKLSEHIQRRLAVYMNTPPRIPFFRRFAFTIVAGSILLSGAATCWYLAQNNKSAPITDSMSAAKTDQAFVQRPASVDVAPATDRPQENGAVSVSNNAQNAKAVNFVQPAQITNLPATQPGKENQLEVKQELPAQQQPIVQQTNPNPGNDNPNTRVANNNAPLRVKSVIVYPPVTHVKTTKRESHGGEITRSANNDADFQLDEMPTYPGGDEALQQYIIQNFHPTTVDRATLTRFSTGIRFVVNSKTGEISAPEISFSISPAVDAELLRVINSMPGWNPGKKKGEVDVMIGVTFE